MVGPRKPEMGCVMTAPMEHMLAAIGGQMSVAYLPTVREPLPKELEDLVVQLAAFEMRERVLVGPALKSRLRMQVIGPGCLDVTHCSQRVDVRVLLDVTQRHGKNTAASPVQDDHAVSLELIEGLEKLLHIRGVSPAYFCC